MSSTPTFSSSDPKTALMSQVRHEAAVTNARILIDKVNEHCFGKCFPNPGPSMSKKEDACFTQCMQKYMDTWNTVAKQYSQRAEQEARSRGVGIEGM
ncbi:protein translocase subunit [Agyrium rufum]|nr:protein translocase subunit [Agyrium rufum]